MEPSKPVKDAIKDFAKLSNVFVPEGCLYIFILKKGKEDYGMISNLEEAQLIRVFADLSAQGKPKSVVELPDVPDRGSS